MATTVGAHIRPHNVPARVDPEVKGVRSIGDIKRGELVSAQQKAMGSTVGSVVLPNRLHAPQRPNFGLNQLGDDDLWGVPSALSGVSAARRIRPPVGYLLPLSISATLAFVRWFNTTRSLCEFAIIPLP
jgi:hypothetical protein